MIAAYGLAELDPDYRNRRWHPAGGNDFRPDWLGRRPLRLSYRRRLFYGLWCASGGMARSPPAAILAATIAAAPLVGAVLVSLGRYGAT